MLNILECSPIAQFAIGIDHKITYWNRACELLTGYSAMEMIGTDRQWQPFYLHQRPVLADLIIDNDFNEFQKLYNGKSSSRSKFVPSAWEATDFFKNLGGKPRHVFFIAAPILDTDDRISGAIETLQDITRVVRTEEDLRASEERYRILTEHVADGVVLIQNGRFIFANDACSSMFGYRNVEDLFGKNPLDLISDDSKPSFREMGKAFDSGKFTKMVLQMQCLKSDGNEFWVEVHSNVIKWAGEPAFLATIRDITDSKLREIAIEEEAEYLRLENVRLRSSMKDRYGFGDIIGKSSAMQEIYGLILKAADSNANVIIYGESGTGKELVAQAIHNLSERREKSFVPVNCGAIPEKLIESEFFGYKKGAFTGANTDKNGYLDLADGGTLFLDELGELSLTMQVKLLRAIDGGGYSPVGSTKTERSDFRIIGATNSNLGERINKGLMREDFFFRIHVIPITVPPLRNRREDIPLLIEHFLTLHGNGNKINNIPGKILEAMYNYHWPGNVRELQNVLQRYLTVKRLDLMSSNPKTQPVEMDHALAEEGNLDNFNLRGVVEDLEKAFISRTLNQTCWNRTEAATLLGISRRALFRKMKNFKMI
jgi:PAS domain S-box-containing protein